MEQTLVYGGYVVAGLVALAVYTALPKAGRVGRRGLALVLAAIAVGGLVILAGEMLRGAAGRVYFHVLAILAVLGGIRVVTHPRPVYSAVYFLMVVLSTAGMIVLAGAEFLAAALVIVYAGAILVTYVFVIMMAQQSAVEQRRLSGTTDYDRAAREPAAAVLAGFVLMATVAGVIAAQSKRIGSGGLARADNAVVRIDAGASRGVESEPASEPEGNTRTLGRVLLNGNPVSVELAGVLLMVAMVGAIAIARKRIPPVPGETVAAPPGQAGKEVKPF